MLEKWICAFSTCCSFCFDRIMAVSQLAAPNRNLSCLERPKNRRPANVKLKWTGSRLNLSRVASNPTLPQNAVLSKCMEIKFWLVLHDCTFGAFSIINVCTHYRYLFVWISLWKCNCSIFGNAVFITHCQWFCNQSVRLFEMKEFIVAMFPRFSSMLSQKTNKWH